MDAGAVEVVAQINGGFDHRLICLRMSDTDGSGLHRLSVDNFEKYAAHLIALLIRNDTVQHGGDQCGSLIKKLFDGTVVLIVQITAAGIDIFNGFPEEFLVCLRICPQ